MSKIKTSQDGATTGFPLQCEMNPPHCILVVNDDADIHRHNVEGLRRHGYEVGVAEDVPDLPFGHQQRLATAFRNLDNFIFGVFTPIVRASKRDYFLINTI